MKKNRNLLYPLPIAEVNEEKLMRRMSLFIGQEVEKINLKFAAEYVGIVNALWEYRTIEPVTLNGEEIHRASLAAYVMGQSESLSFAFRYAHGVQRFDIKEIGKKGTSEFLFSVTDVEFYEDHIVFFGIAKDKDTHKEKEYLVYWFLDNFEFYSSPIQHRKLGNRVIFDLTEVVANKLSRIVRYAYRYLKRTDEVKLSKLTELLTGKCINKPNKQMFIALNKELQLEDNSDERKNFISDVLQKSFHRFVQTSLEGQDGLFVQDSEGIFQLSMENIVPTSDKKGFRFQGLREYTEEPWKNYRINLEYDYKKNEIFIYDKEWFSSIGKLTWEDTLSNLKEIKNFRRCINIYYRALKN